MIFLFAPGIQKIYSIYVVCRQAQGEKKKMAGTEPLAQRRNSNNMPFWGMVIL
jgi:hypothetical protein